jgi:SAM-dependent methyltransferase
MAEVGHHHHHHDHGAMRGPIGFAARLGVTRWVREKHHRDRYAIVRRLVDGRGRRLLDVGCGPPAETMPDGSFLRFLGYGVGVDLARRTIPFPFVQGQIEALPFRDRTFEVVTCLEVIEHVTEVDRALDELARVVRDGGVVVLTTPNNHLGFKLIWFAWERLVGGIWAHTHVSSLNKRGWLRVLDENGRFRVTSIQNYWGINLIMRLEKPSAT